MAKKRENTLDGESLYQALKQQKDPLKGLTLDEVAALSRAYIGTEYGTYGKLVGYVHAWGKLPPRNGPVKRVTYQYHRRRMVPRGEGE